MSSPSLPLQPPNCLISDRRLIVMNILCTGRPDAAYAALIFTLKETCVRHIQPVVLKLWSHQTLKSAIKMCWGSKNINCERFWQIKNNDLEMCCYCFHCAPWTVHGWAWSLLNWSHIKIEHYKMLSHWVSSHDYLFNLLSAFLLTISVKIERVNTSSEWCPGLRTVTPVSASQSTTKDWLHFLLFVFICPLSRVHSWSPWRYLSPNWYRPPLAKNCSSEIYSKSTLFSLGLHLLNGTLENSLKDSLKSDVGKEDWSTWTKTWMNRWDCDGHYHYCLSLLYWDRHTDTHT